MSLDLVEKLLTAEMLGLFHHPRRFGTDSGAIFDSFLMDRMSALNVPWSRAREGAGEESSLVYAIRSRVRISAEVDASESCGLLRSSEAGSLPTPTNFSDEMSFQVE